MYWDVNGKTIPTPSTLNFTISDIDGESNRNAKGDMVRDRIAVKRKLDLGWNALNNEELHTLLNAVCDKSKSGDNVFFTVEFFDPMENKRVKCTMYVGDRSMPEYWNPTGKDEDILWKSMTMNLIER